MAATTFVPPLRNRQNRGLDDDNLIFETSPGVEAVTSFDQMGIRNDSLKGIYAFGFEKPSAIQQRAVMPVVGGQDMIAQAQFGTENPMASSFFFPILPLLLLCFSTLGSSFEPLNMEVEALIAIMRDFNDPHGVLSNWDEDSVDPCSWAMITCSSQNLVIGLFHRGAPSQGLSGKLSAMIGNLTNLQQV